MSRVSRTRSAGRRSSRRSTASRYPSRSASLSGPTAAPAIADAWPNGLQEVWRARVGGGYAGVSVVNGRVYTMDHREQPEEAERVLCFDAKTGELLWEHAYPVGYGDLATALDQQF